MKLASTEILKLKDLEIVTFEQFESELNTYQEKLNKINTVDKLKVLLTTNFSDLCRFYLKMGDYVESLHLSLDNEVDITNTYLVNYNIPEHFKTTLILHRDVILEVNKVKILEKEQVHLTKIAKPHFEKSKATLENQLLDLQKTISTSKIALEKNPKTQKKYARQLSLIQNPWAVYKTQFEVLLQQFDEIEYAKQVLDHTVAVFKELKAVSDTISKNHDRLNSKLQSNIAHILKEIGNVEVHKKLILFIEEQLGHDISIGNDQAQLSEELYVKINRLKKIKAPISSENGMMIFREIDLSKAVKKWFDYQVLPELMDLVTIENSLKGINSISLTNLKNNLQHAKNSNEIESRTKFEPNLDHFQQDLVELKIKGEEIAKRINDKIHLELQVANIFREKSFLDISFNSSLNFKSNSVLNTIKQPIKKGLSFFNAQIKNTTSFPSESSLELATDCINYRMFKQADEHYDSLFLNKKFIGDLFLISREEQEETLHKTIQQWQDGFNKSALIFGDRLSGRSTFLDYTSKKYFGHNCIVLQPNSMATIDGRKFKTTNDLKEALQYIKKNNIQGTKPAIIIDDLELWRDNDFSLLYNIRALINFIESESDDALVIASTTKAMMQHLDARLNFSNVFSTLIDVSKSEKEQIVEALMLRHGAAHRNLIGKDLEPMTSKMIQKAIVKLSHQYQYNLGDVLQAWTFNTFVQENNELRFKVEDHEFPDFFLPEELLILKQASIFKIVSELGLKRVTASGFESDYKSAVKRLINTKVLLRNNLGHLYINPVVLRDVNLFINQRN